MKKEIRTIVYDEELQIEAYRLEGIVRPFPNHFHEHYAIGFVEHGQRVLSCKGKEYVIGKGSIVLFNPGDNHSCVQSDGGVMDYRGLNINKECMLNLAEEVTGRQEFPRFSRNVIDDEEIACYLRLFHEMMMDGMEEGKEETLLFLISALIQNYGDVTTGGNQECRQEIEKACALMDCRYREHINLEWLCSVTSLSKSTLLREFTKFKGVTPYRYLENVRINEARKLLGKGVSPLDAAIQTGFSDQSHFTNYFSRFIGIAPGVYREIFCDRKKDREQDGK